MSVGTRLQYCFVLSPQSFGHSAAEKKQEDLQLPCVSLKQSVVTRWNSAVKVLKQLFGKEAAVTSVMAMLGKRDLQPSAAKWETIEEPVPLLEPFVEATKFLSYECQPSLSMVEPVLAFLLQKMEAGAGVQM